MKTKLITLSVLLLSAFALKAQENYINYNLYNPDTCFSFQSSADTLKFDLDQDGTYDIYFDAYYQSGAGLLVTINTPSPDWQWSWTYANAFVPLTDTTMIDETLRWQYGYWELAMYPEFTHFAFRHQTVDGYHYGWAHIYLTRATRAWHTVCVSGMGYCTLPDQPIQWGQTELLSIEENKETNGNAFVVYPNPAKGILFVETRCATSLPDQNEYRITNMMGQTLLQGRITVETQQIDISDLPAGMYFISLANITQKFIVK